MKKVFLALIAVVAIGTSTSFAQKAIGLRFGGGSAFGAEVSYQQGMGSNRLEADFGFSGGEHHSYISAVGIYHWKFNFFSVPNMQWYVGPGAALGIYLDENNTGLTLGIGGQIGLEYDFSAHGVPFNLSVDARPMFNFINHTGLNWGACLSLRYLL